MTNVNSSIVLSFIILALLGGCTAMAGNFEHYPASLPAVLIMIVGKFLNDRYRLVKWPMEFILWSAVLMIFLNLLYLHFKPF